jgi:hypothetical protein
VAAGDDADDLLHVEAGVDTLGRQAATACAWSLRGGTPDVHGSAGATVGIGSRLDPPSVRPMVARKCVGRWRDARCWLCCGIVQGILLGTETSGPARARGYCISCLFFGQRGSAGERRRGGRLIVLNNGGGPRVSSCAKMKIYAMPIPH